MNKDEAEQLARLTIERTGESLRHLHQALNEAAKQCQVSIYADTISAIERLVHMRDAAIEEIYDGGDA